MFAQSWSSLEGTNIYHTRIILLTEVDEFNLFETEFPLRESSNHPLLNAYVNILKVTETVYANLVDSEIFDLIMLMKFVTNTWSNVGSIPGMKINFKYRYW